MLPPNNHGRSETLRFRYSAIRKDRSLVRGVIQAPTEAAAKEILLLQYDHLLTLEEIVSQNWWQMVAALRDPSEALPVYTRGLAVMMDAGLPMTSMFDVAARGEDEYLNKVMLDVADSIRQGRSLSKSLSRWRTVFDSAFIGMCQSAEKSGRLHVTFRRLANLLEKRWRMTKRIRAAFAYPILISVVALAIFWILVAVVVPDLVPIFTSMGVQLPWPTRVLVWLGNLSSSMPIIMGVAVACLICLRLLYRSVVRGEQLPWLHLWWDQLRLTLPVAGQLFRLAILSRTLSTMAALIESGLPLADVFRCAGQVSGSPVYQRAFDKILLHIKEGGSFAQALEEAGGFPPLLVGIAQVGEESGKLPFLLVKAATVYEDDLDMKLDALATLLEPIMLGIMGIIIGFIVLGTFLPLITLVQQF